jgi:hypothetical protein
MIMKVDKTQLFSERMKMYALSTRCKQETCRCRNGGRNRVRWNGQKTSLLTSSSSSSPSSSSPSPACETQGKPS